jgi:mRNA interferase MazF
MVSPNRGEVWLVDLGLAAKMRPCVILSIPAVGQNDRVLVTVVSHTTSPRGSEFEVALPVRFLKAGVFDAQNLVTVPHAKLVRKLGTLPTDQLAEVEVAVRRWLGL